MALNGVENSFFGQNERVGAFGNGFRGSSPAMRGNPHAMRGNPHPGGAGASERQSPSIHALHILAAGAARIAHAGSVA